MKGRHRYDDMTALHCGESGKALHWVPCLFYHAFKVHLHGREAMAATSFGLDYTSCIDQCLLGCFQVNQAPC